MIRPENLEDPKADFPEYTDAQMESLSDFLDNTEEQAQLLYDLSNIFLDINIPSDGEDCE